MLLVYKCKQILRALVVKVLKKLLLKPSFSDENGMILKEDTTEIEIPAGVSEGMQLKIQGEGNEGPFDGINGDLIVLIEEKHEELSRDGMKCLL